MAKQVLAVDDDPDVLLIIQTALQTEGFTVRTACNGPDCIESATADPPDLILLDVMMPGMNGFEVVAKLKEESSTSMIPIILLTGLSDRKKVQEALASGVDYYIVKPFDFDDLISKVNQAIEGDL